MRYTDKSDEAVYNEIKTWVKAQFPKDGTWFGEYHKLPLGSNKFFFENIPYHATDVDWLKEYIVYNYKHAYNYTLLRQKAMLNFLESDEFLAMVEEYQNKIIDWQIEWSRRHNDKGILFYLSSSAEDKTKWLSEEVYSKLISILNMDENVVKKGLETRKEALTEMHQRMIDAVKEMPSIAKATEGLDNDLLYGKGKGCDD